MEDSLKRGIRDETINFGSKRIKRLSNDSSATSGDENFDITGSTISNKGSLSVNSNSSPFSRTTICSMTTFSDQESDIISDDLPTLDGFLGDSDCETTVILAEKTITEDTCCQKNQLLCDSLTKSHITSVDKVLAGQQSKSVRSPLVAVSCNNNFILSGNSIPPNRHVQSKEAIATKDFNDIIGPNHFESLSDEMLLYVFKWLPKKALIRCSMVCKRFNRVTKDETLWMRLELSNRCVMKEAMDYILPRQIRLLRCSQTNFRDPLLSADFIRLNPNLMFKIQLLDLSMASISTESLHQLLSRCNQLVKLSLEHIDINEEICEDIAKNIDLNCINLTMCRGLTANGIKKLLLPLTKLHTLNISWTQLSEECINAFIESINPNLQRLNIAGSRKTLQDRHVNDIIDRCTKLEELDLSDSSNITEKVMHYFTKLNELKLLSISRCYNIPESAFGLISTIKKIEYLNIFGLVSDVKLKQLEETYRCLGINKFVCSAVARPTVGVRRTSIWGVRIRD